MFLFGINFTLFYLIFIKNFKEFFKNEEEQAIVRESGVRLSVGFDGHRIEDYLPGRVKDYCERITALGIKLAFED